MPISSGFGGGLPGLTLKAWARVTAAGVLVKSAGVASVTRPVTGIYSVTLANAVSVVASGKVLPLGQPVATCDLPIGSVATVSLFSSAGGSPANGDFYVEFYE